MPVYRPSELRQFLDQLQTGPKKHLSQNFLTDGNILRKIVKTAEVQKGDQVLEIGPGPGALTECLLEAGAEVTAIEKDPVLAGALSRLDHISPLHVVTADVMEVELEKLFTKKAKVIANLPYHLTSPILGLVVPHNDIFDSVHVMVQEEVARRMTAKPGSKDYSSLTVFLNFYSEPRYSFFVSRKCFFPAPKVDSAVVSLYLKPTPKDIDPHVFLKIVHTAFGQRRKMLRVTLKELLGAEKVESILQSCNIDPTARPEQISIGQWETLCRTQIPRPSSEKA